MFQEECLHVAAESCCHLRIPPDTATPVEHIRTPCRLLFSSASVVTRTQILPKQARPIVAMLKRLCAALRLRCRAVILRMRLTTRVEIASNGAVDSARPGGKSALGSCFLVFC